jgi:hypothetical protein
MGLLMMRFGQYTISDTDIKTYADMIGEDEKTARRMIASLSVLLEPKIARAAESARRHEEDERMGRIDI